FRHDGGLRQAIVRDDVKRGQSIGVAAGTGHRGSAGRTLERSESENAPAISREDELHQPAAEAADAVGQKEMFDRVHAARGRTRARTRARMSMSSDTDACFISSRRRPFHGSSMASPRLLPCTMA